MRPVSAEQDLVLLQPGTERFITRLLPFIISNVTITERYHPAAADNCQPHMKAVM